MAARAVSFPSLEQKVGDLPFVLPEPTHLATRLFFQIASYLSEPVCQVRELYYSLWTIDELYKDEHKALLVFRKCVAVIGMLLCAIVTPITAPVGIALRAATAAAQTTPFIYSRDEAHRKPVSNEQRPSLLSWNVCCTPAGYEVTSGGVGPFDGNCQRDENGNLLSRVEMIVRTIIREDADTVCLYEAFDERAARYIADRLHQAGYLNCFRNIGPHGVGPNSGTLVATRFEAIDPRFTRFPLDTLVGTTKYAAKGVFQFKIGTDPARPQAQIYATHLQHSRVPSDPQPVEQDFRWKQMCLIKGLIEKAQEPPSLPIFVTGDLNMDDEEYNKSDWASDFYKPDQPKEEKTWLGEKWGSDLEGGRASPPCNLDYTMLYTKGGLRSEQVNLLTTLIDTGFEHTKFRREALSDHRGLKSHFSV